MLTYAPKRKGRSTGPSDAVVEDVLTRAGLTCECCDHMLGDRRGVDFSLHHRRPRQMGGTRWAGINLPSNLMVVCGSGTTGCHGEIESHRALAIQSGWLVPSVTDPTNVPILLHQERYVYLTDDAMYSDNPPALLTTQPESEGLSL